MNKTCISNKQKITLSKLIKNADQFIVPFLLLFHPNKRIKSNFDIDVILNEQYGAMHDKMAYIFPDEHLMLSNLQVCCLKIVFDNPIAFEWMIRCLAAVYGISITPEQIAVLKGEYSKRMTGGVRIRDLLKIMAGVAMILAGVFQIYILYGGIDGIFKQSHTIMKLEKALQTILRDGSTGFIKDACKPSEIDSILADVFLPKDKMRMLEYAKGLVEPGCIGLLKEWYQGGNTVVDVGVKIMKEDDDSSPDTYMSNAMVVASNGEMVPLETTGDLETGIILYIPNKGIPNTNIYLKDIPSIVGKLHIFHDSIKHTVSDITAIHKGYFTGYMKIDRYIKYIKPLQEMQEILMPGFKLVFATQIYDLKNNIYTAGWFDAALTRAMNQAQDLITELSRKLHDATVSSERMMEDLNKDIERARNEYEKIIENLITTMNMCFAAAGFVVTGIGLVAKGIGWKNKEPRRLESSQLLESSVSSLPKASLLDNSNKASSEVKQSLALTLKPYEPKIPKGALTQEIIEKIKAEKRDEELIKEAEAAKIQERRSMQEKKSSAFKEFKALLEEAAEKKNKKSSHTKKYGPKLGLNDAGSNDEQMWPNWTGLPKQMTKPNSGGSRQNKITRKYKNVISRRTKRTHRRTQHKNWRTTRKSLV